MKLRDKQLHSQLSNTSKTFVWKSAQAVQFIVDSTGSGYNLFALNRHGNY